jgi:hypothetical protein
MMDMDEVCSGKMNLSNIDYFLQLERANNPLPWDALSFNLTTYYDIWALSVYPYTFSCWHYPKSKTISNDIRSYIQQKLLAIEPCSLLPCISAFNGFSIYRTNKFVDIDYEWNVHKTIAIYPKTEIDIMSRFVRAYPIARHDDCEHRYFHIRATQLNNARICISPLIIFHK